MRLGTIHALAVGFILLRPALNCSVCKASAFHNPSVLAKCRHGFDLKMLGDCTVAATAPWPSSVWMNAFSATSGPQPIPRLFLTIASVYIPHENTNDERIRQRAWEDLADFITETPEAINTIIMGDLNINLHEKRRMRKNT